MKYSTSNFQKTNQFKVNENAEGTVLSEKERFLLVALQKLQTMSCPRAFADIVT
jgi:hypothetical protein